MTVVDNPVKLLSTVYTKPKEICGSTINAEYEIFQNEESD